MRLIVQAVACVVAVLIAWSLFKTALHFLWFPAMMVVVAVLLLYLVMNQRRQ